MELRNGNVGLMGVKKMRKLHPSLLCEFYEELLRDDPRLYGEEEAFDEEEEGNFDGEETGDVEVEPEKVGAVCSMEEEEGEVD